MWKWFAALWNVPVKEAALKAAGASVCTHAIDQGWHSVTPQGQACRGSGWFSYSCYGIRVHIVWVTPFTLQSELEVFQGISPALVPGSLT